MEHTICKGLPPIWLEFRERQELCDAIIKSVDGKIFHVHSVILACSNPFFRVFFTSPHLKREGETILSSLDGKTLKTLIDFAYTGKIPVKEDNVKDFIRIADMFHVEGMIEQCCSFFKENMSPDNCLSIIKFCRTYNCPEIVEETRRFILIHFKEIFDKGEFREIEFEEMLEYLRDDLLNVKKEEDVFEAIKSWVEYRPDERASFVIKLLQFIRFGLLSYEFFKNSVLSWNRIQESQVAQDSIFDASIFLAQRESRNENLLELDLIDPLVRPRIPNEIIFLIGGWSGGTPTCFMETYDSRTDRWLMINAADCSPRMYHILLTIDNIIYAIGGKSIYAMGGFNGRRRMSSAERYNIESNQWDLIAPMHLERSDASACSFNGKVIVAGGFNGREVYRTVESFDPTVQPAGVWTLIKSMGSLRCGLMLTTYRNHIYALGGFNGTIRLNTCEKYDPLSPDDWQPVPNMINVRSNFTSVVMDDQIIAIGGFNGLRTIPYVEAYDATTNEWCGLANMNLSRSGLSACVLRALPNAQDYSYLSRVQCLMGLGLRTETED